MAFLSRLTQRRRLGDSQEARKKEAAAPLSWLSAIGYNLAVAAVINTS